MFDKIVQIWEYINNHWVLISLVVSEIAAFLPNKWNGIVQSVLKAAARIFKKNNVSPKIK